MISLHHITDTNTIINLLKKDDVYKSVLGINIIDLWKLDLKTEAVFAGMEDDKLIGVAFLQDTNSGYVEVHIGLYKEFRNQKSVYYMKKVLKLLKRITYPLHILCPVEINNIAAWTICEKAGMKYKKTKEFNNKQYKIYSE